MMLNSLSLKIFAKLMDNLNFTFNENLIKQKLFPFDSPKRISLKDEFFTPSAILFSIVPHEKNIPYELIIIHRTDRGLKHRGEMSFPGGKFDPVNDQTLQDTALREAEEEIGVPRDKIKILGCLHDMVTLTKYTITPFVAVIDKNQKLVKEEREVQEILKIPITFFLERKNFKEQIILVEDDKFPIFYFNYYNPKNGKKYTVWGATAYMIASFFQQVYGYHLSRHGIKRFNLERIRQLKDYIKYKREITSKF
ncbi:MAG: CoA pyrophosphatase [Promethearchaeota archaeon]|nr:MAG: CoA pyrophosphatase [Candidatus Lokiarchaeota archaeon]